MTFYQTVAMWGILAGLAFFICLWSLGYLVMVGIIVETVLRGLMPWDRAIIIILAMILLWPVALGVALSKSRLPTDEPDPVIPPSRNAKGPCP